VIGDHESPINSNSSDGPDRAFNGMPVMDCIVEVLYLRAHAVPGTLYLDKHTYFQLMKELGDKLGRIYPYKDGGIRWPGPWGWVTVKMAEDLAFAAKRAAQQVAKQEKAAAE
jgi:hypothetical protein